MECVLCIEPSYILQILQVMFFLAIVQSFITYMMSQIAVRLLQEYWRIPHVGVLILCYDYTYFCKGVRVKAGTTFLTSSGLQDKNTSCVFWLITSNRGKM